ARRFRRAFLWGEYGSKDFRCTERRHRKTGTELQAFAKTHLPALKHHLEMARALAKAHPSK
ncbi:MAG: hypothetical protein E6801_33400, partial [Pseudomonas aeruginosa]|nr:hypothetical protein [Pseudomonas aeruginosa]